jgi:hypothetical protein
MLDITNPPRVEIVVRADGKTIWVNVDGIYTLRICQIKYLIIEDQRKDKIFNQSSAKAERTKTNQPKENKQP